MTLIYAFFQKYVFGKEELKSNNVLVFGIIDGVIFMVVTWTYLLR